MQIRDITIKQKTEFSTLATHPLQSYEWGEFREKTGVKVIRRGFYEKGKIVAGFQVTIHKIPHAPWTIGYLPKGTMPTKEMLEELVRIGRKNKCVFIQLEPDVEKFQISIRQLADKFLISNKKPIGHWIFVIGNYLKFQPATQPLFTKYTFVLDLTKSEQELLAGMHPKTRYNIRVAQKHGVFVKEETSDKAFEEYLKLTKETTDRQGFYAHTENYHRLMWQTLGPQVSVLGSQLSESSSSVLSSSVTDKQKTGKLATENRKLDFNKLSAHLLVAYYKNIPLTTWILFTFHDTLYYPYGSSSSEHKEIMASNLMMWEAIKFGKKLGLKKFDMWGSLGENPNPKNPWYGFHRFKMGYGPKSVEFVGSYDLVINPFTYQVYKIVDKARWTFLKLFR